MSSPRMPPLALPLGRALLLLLAVLLALSLWRIWAIDHAGITLFVDEAYYWGWSQELAWGYYSKPPLVAWLIAATTGLFGQGILAVKAGSLLLYPATALVLFGLGRQIYTVRTGLWGALAFIGAPITAFLGLAISTDAPLLLCWSAALWLLYNALLTGRWRYWLALGLVVGLGMLAKYTMAAFAMSAAVMLLSGAEPRRQLARPGPWLAACVALLVLAPNLLWNWQHDFPTFRHTAQITQVAADSSNTKGSNLGEFLAAQIGSIGPLLFIGLLGALAGLRRCWQHPGDRLLIAGTLPLLLLVTLEAAAGRANANWAGPAFTGGSLLAVAWLQRRRWGQPLVVASLVLNLALMAGLYHWSSWVALAGKPLSAKIDPFKRMKGWDQISEQLRPWVLANPAAYVLADGRTYLAHAAYQLRDIPLRVAAWNPSNSHNDQYQISHPLPNRPGLDVLYLGQPSAELQARFASSTPLAQLQAQTHPNFLLRLDLWLLHDFKGYP